MKRIAIQGIKGSFHDIAARQYFDGEDIELVECSTFEGVFGATAADENLLALVAIVNSIAGRLLHMYSPSVNLTETELLGPSSSITGRS